jgi:hypothetical protein
VLARSGGQMPDGTGVRTDGIALLGTLDVGRRR